LILILERAAGLLGPAADIQELDRKNVRPLRQKACSKMTGLFMLQLQA